MEEERKKGWGGNSAELQKPNVEAEVYNNNKKCDYTHTHTRTHIYIYTSISKIKTVQQK